MACNNSLTKNDQLNKPEKTPSNVHFDDVSEKSLDKNQQHKGTKCRHSTLAQEQKYKNAIACQIDSLERLLAKIEKDQKRVLSIMLDMRYIYTKYLNEANKTDKKCDEIYICALGLEQELYISNKEREQAVSLLQQQTVKVKRYEKMIDAL